MLKYAVLESHHSCDFSCQLSQINLCLREINQFPYTIDVIIFNSTSNHCCILDIRPIYLEIGCDNEKRYKNNNINPFSFYSDSDYRKEYKYSF